MHDEMIISWRRRISWFRRSNVSRTPSMRLHAIGDDAPWAAIWYVIICRTSPRELKWPAARQGSLCYLKRAEGAADVQRIDIFEHISGWLWSRTPPRPKCPPYEARNAWSWNVIGERRHGNRSHAIAEQYRYWSTITIKLMMNGAVSDVERDAKQLFSKRYICIIAWKMIIINISKMQHQVNRRRAYIPVPA